MNVSYTSGSAWVKVIKKCTSQWKFQHFKIQLSWNLLAIFCKRGQRQKKSILWSQHPFFPGPKNLQGLTCGLLACQSHVWPGGTPLPSCSVPCAPEHFLSETHKGAPAATGNKREVCDISEMPAIKQNVKILEKETMLWNSVIICINLELQTTFSLILFLQTLQTSMLQSHRIVLPHVSIISPH